MIIETSVSLGLTRTALLRSPRLVGDREYKGVVVATDCWPAILDRDTSERLRTMLRAPRKVERANLRRHLLTGLVYCGRFGGAFRVVTMHGVLAFRCPSLPHGCGRLQVSSAALDEYAFEAACKHLAGVASCGYVPLKPSGADTDAAQAEIEAQRTRLKDLGDDYYVHHLITQKEYLSLRSTLLDQVKRAVAQSGVRSPDSGPLPSAEVLRAKWAKLDVQDQRAQLDQLISRILISPARRSAFDASRVTIEWYR